LNRAPRSLAALTAVGIALGVLLTADGLTARLFLRYALAEAWWPWHASAARLGWGPEVMGWPLITFGVWWATGVLAAWQRSRWIHRVLVALAVFTLQFFWTGTILAGCALALLLTPSLRGWLADGGGPAA
jgi:hypothetical protein